MICLRSGTVCFMLMLLWRRHGGQRVTAVPWPRSAARDPLFSLVGAGFASVGKDPPRRGHVAVRVAPAILDLWCAGARVAADLSAMQPARAPTFTRGRIPPWNAPSERQELMNHVAPYLSEFGLSPRFRDGIAVTCTDHHRFPETSGGPLPASLASRPPTETHSRSGSGITAAYRSSRLNDEAHDDRRHARGRNPRRGAGR
jgi:hypothetical protein